jgi:Domain of unknown function (DUF4184)
MPFTFAHPAAAVPLRRPLGRYGALSALVIGSLSPDIAYFLPLSVAHSESHSLIGLLLFCLPVSLISYALFHLLLKGPLLGLLPDFALRRLGAHTLRFQTFPRVSWAAVIVSSLSGGATHLLWDSFTHETGSAVMALPLFRVTLFEIGGNPIHVYKLLQHASTCVGLALLCLWTWRWLKQTRERPVFLPVMLSRAQRLLAITAIACIPAAAGMRAGAQSLGPLDGVPAAKAFVAAAVLSGLPALVFALVMYSVGWHFWKVRKRISEGDQF